MKTVRSANFVGIMGLDDFVTDKSVSERNTSSSNSSSGATTPDPTDLDELEMTFYPTDYTTTKLKEGLWKVDQLDNNVIFTREYLEQVLEQSRVNFDKTTTSNEGESIYVKESNDGQFKIRVWSSIKEDKDKCTVGLYRRLYVDIIDSDTYSAVLPRKYVSRFKGFEKKLKQAIADLLDSKTEIVLCKDCNSQTIIERPQGQRICTECGKIQ